MNIQEGLDFSSIIYNCLYLSWYLKSCIVTPFWTELWHLLDVILKNFGEHPRSIRNGVSLLPHPRDAQVLSNNMRTG